VWCSPVQASTQLCLEKFKVLGESLVSKLYGIDGLYPARDALIRELKAPVFATVLASQPSQPMLASKRPASHSSLASRAIRATVCAARTFIILFVLDAWCLEC
jgi:hypothetical protein